jgi:D-alanyl-D-alanine carboxypeptidase
VTSNYKNTGMCMSWFTGKLKGYRYFTHAGGGGGYYSELRIYPDLGIGSVLLFNRSGMRDQRFLDKVDKHILADKALTQKAAEIKLSDGLRKLTASAYE